MGLFRLNPFFTSSQKLKYIEYNCSCPVLVCGELEPLWRAMKWYQLSGQISITQQSAHQGKLLVTIKKKKKMPMPVTAIVHTQKTKHNKYICCISLPRDIWIFFARIKT